VISHESPRKTVFAQFLSHEESGRGRGVMVWLSSHASKGWTTTSCDDQVIQTEDEEYDAEVAAPRLGGSRKRN
jgi:hypothetical protein